MYYKIIKLYYNYDNFFPSWSLQKYSLAIMKYWYLTSYVIIMLYNVLK